MVKNKGFILLVVMFLILYSLAGVIATDFAGLGSIVTDQGYYSCYGISCTAYVNLTISASSPFAKVTATAFRSRVPHAHAKVGRGFRQHPAQPANCDHAVGDRGARRGIAVHRARERARWIWRRGAYRLAAA